MAESARIRIFFRMMDDGSSMTGANVNVCVDIGIDLNTYQMWRRNKMSRPHPKSSLIS